MVRNNIEVTLSECLVFYGNEVLSKHISLLKECQEFPIIINYTDNRLKKFDNFMFKLTDK